MAGRLSAGAHPTGTGSGRRVRRIVSITVLAAATLGCPLPFQYNGPGSGSSHSDPSSPSMTAPVMVSYSEQGGTSGTIADGSGYVSGLSTTVTLSTATDNAVIYYYTDGGSPLTNLGAAKKISASSGTITITRTTSVQSLDIRAIAIGSNMLPSPAVHVTVSVSPYPILSVTVDKASVSEDGGTATFTITSSSASTSNITVNLLTSGNYTPADLTGPLPASGTPFTATLTQSTTTITLPITGVHDPSNLDHSVTLAIQADTNNPPTYTVGASASASVVLKDDGAPAYTVTYSGNGSDGGTVPTDGAFYSTGATVTVLGPGSMSLTNGVFAGWNTQADGSGTTYSGGNMFAMGAGNVNLFAIWLAVTGTTITSVPVTATGVVIPEGVTSFGTVFRNHPNLRSVTIPSSVTTIVVQAFLSCPQLTTIVSNNSRYAAINGALVDTQTGTLMLVPSKLGGAFFIPSVTSIDPYAFDQCTSLTSVTIPASLTTISGNGFSGLQSAIAITIPATVTAIASFGFYNCSVTSLIMQSATPPTLGSSVFSAPLPTIHVPNAGAVNAYLSDPTWSPYGLSIVTP